MNKQKADIDVEITLFLHISIRFIIFSDGYHSSFLIVFIGSKKPRKPHEQRRKRAIILFACQSFAWFTSKDEVTNRLSANADYGVSIVESFAPPENWLPGQQVNKDVYAVNTGNVAAFVEETVSGRLTITKEVPDGITPTANSIKLSAAEVYVMEDGSYLAYKPEKSNLTLGNKVVAMNPDLKDKNGYTAADSSDFEPDAAGLYVFRRSIGVDPITKIETFKYEGYYFDGHDFYKVDNLQVVPDGASYAGDNVYTDGNLDSATYNLVKEETTVVNPVDLKYEAKTADHPNRLVATYKTATTDGDAALPNLAKKYDDALVAYQDALEEYSHALSENTNADGATVTANEGLQSKLETYRTALKNLTDAQDALVAAEKAKDDAVDAVTAANNALDAANQAVAAAQATVNDRTNADDDAQADVEAAKTALYGYSDGGTTNGANDTKTDGTDSEGFYKTTSPYGKWIAAKTAREAADANGDGVGDTTPRQALEALLNAYITAHSDTSDPGYGNCHVVTGYDSESNPIYGADVSLTTVTYDQLFAMNLVNTGDPRYDYYELVVAEKLAEKDKNDKQDALDEANNAKALTAQQLDDAKRALYGYKDGGTTTKADDKTEGTDSANCYKSNSIYGKMKAAEDNVDAKKRALYGYKDGGITTKADDKTEGTDSANCYKSTSKYGEYMAAIDDVKAKTTALYGYSDGGTTNGASDTKTDGTDSANFYKTTSPYGQYVQAQADYDAAVANNGGTSNNLTAARNNLAIKTQALADAKAAYEKASGISDGELKININLSDDVVTTGGTADKWQLLPNPVVDDTAYFYYTSILDPSETSAQLIDSVELDSSVTEDMFKRFDFDLNVGLKSAQIAMANDGKTILTTAADTTLDATATLATPTSVDTAITWSATVSAPKYTAAHSAKSTNGGSTYDSDAGAVSIKRLDTPVKIGNTYCSYEITDGNDKYYGNAITNGTEFINDENSDKRIKLTEDATIDNT